MTQAIKSRVNDERNKERFKPLNVDSLVKPEQTRKRIAGYM